MGLSRKLRKNRKFYKLTQAQLAEEIQVSTESIRRWESGKNLPSPKHCYLLSQFFNKSMDYFLKENTMTNEEKELYRILGREIIKLSNCNTPLEFWNNYNICEKESTLLLPKKSSEDFLKLISQYSITKDINDSQNLKLSKTAKLFFLRWYEFNRTNQELTKTTKFELLCSLEKIFMTLPAKKIPLIPTNPAFLLRNLMIYSILQSEESSPKFLKDYNKDILKNEELFYPIQYYKIAK